MPWNRLPMCAIAGVTCIAALAGCGSSQNAMDPGPMAPPGNTSAYRVTSLVSDGAVPANTVDAHLKNPWGVVFNGGGLNGGGGVLAPVWVANNGTNTATLYDGTGAPFPLAALPFVFPVPAGSNGPANPTGIVFNKTSDFQINAGTGLGLPASFIFSGEGGTIAAFNNATLQGEVTVFDSGAAAAVYKGLALASNGSANFLYATDFHNNRIDVFDKGFQKVAAAGGFSDPALPQGYAPFGIQAIGNSIYVSYAPQKAPENHDEMDGPGLGLVDVYDADGHLLKRLVTGGRLNAPWGMALAPADFGQFSNALLVGNFGDGTINAFDPASGAFLGTVSNANGKAIAYPGLWGIVFGNDIQQQPHNTLFFAAGINGEADGLYGRIDLVPAGGG